VVVSASVVRCVGEVSLAVRLNLDNFPVFLLDTPAFWRISVHNGVLDVCAFFLNSLSPRKRGLATGPRGGSRVPKADDARPDRCGQAENRHPLLRSVFFTYYLLVLVLWFPPPRPSPLICRYFY
jgi:hypothetical protein